MSKSYVLVTAFGKDRPGMVASVAEALFDLGGNLEDASMTRLGGEFTMMLVASFAKTVRVPAIEKSLKPYGIKTGLDYSVKPIPPSAARLAAKESGAPYLISVYGTDRPGLVSRVTRILADHKISITDLNTRVLRKTDKPVYILLIEAEGSAKTDWDGARSALDDARQALGVEITLQDISAATL